jgi:hypothetical protein
VFFAEVVEWGDLFFRTEGKWPNRVHHGSHGPSISMIYPLNMLVFNSKPLEFPDGNPHRCHQEPSNPSIKSHQIMVNVTSHPNIVNFKSHENMINPNNIN